MVLGDVAPPLFVAGCNFGEPNFKAGTVKTCKNYKPKRHGGTSQTRRGTGTTGQWLACAHSIVKFMGAFLFQLVLRSPAD